MAVQHLLLANPRKAKEVAILLLLGASNYMPRVSVLRHDCLSAFAQADAPPVSYQGVEQEAKRLAAALGLADDNEDRARWQLLCCPGRNATSLYEALKALSDEDLDRLHLLLTVLAGRVPARCGEISQAPPQLSYRIKRYIKEGSHGFPGSLSALVTSSTPAVQTHVTGSGHLPLRCPITTSLLTDPLAGARAAPEQQDFSQAPDMIGQLQRPLPVYTAAPPWPSPYHWLAQARSGLGVSSHEARRSCDTPGRAPVAGPSHLLPYTTWRCAVSAPPRADADSD